jgi:hypothetical protein
MTTYREAIYMCLDLLKGSSDDFTYTEYHIAYLLDKARAFLLKQRYGNDPKKFVPYSNYQTVNIQLKDKGEYFKSVEEIPYMLQLGIPRVSTQEYYNCTYAFVSRERLPFVGINRYLKNIIYCAIDDTNHFIVKKPVDLTVSENLSLTAIFENPKEIIVKTNSENFEWLDENLPIEEGLIISLIEATVKELLGSSYRPDDYANNNVDDNSKMANFIANNMKDRYNKEWQQ